MKLRAATFLLALLTLLSFACTTPPSNEGYVPTKLPDPANFPPVSFLLTVRCGSLDCHGNIARNLRIYGSAGRRWSSADQPLVPLCDTPDEVAQTYASLVGLEPEQVDAVASGADPGNLTMVRKARGTEAHKGEKIWSLGDDSDVCLTSWLGGTSNSAACSRALAAALPSVAGSPNPILQCISP